jgi:hypothetical protein
MVSIQRHRICSVCIREKYAMRRRKRDLSSYSISVRRTDVHDLRYNWLVLGNEKYPCHLSLLGTQIFSTSLGAILLAEQL